MTERDQTAIFSLNGHRGEPEGLGVYDDFAAEEQSADFGHGLISLRFLKEAVRHSALFLFITAIVGLLVGFGAYKTRPHQDQASASVLLTLGPYENSETAPAENQALAKTSPVAARVVQELGLQQSASNFLNTYTALSVTDRLLTITASAPSANQAVLQANAVANAFLTFRADEMQAQRTLVLESLNQQIDQAKQRMSSINAQISQVSSQSQISSLRAQQTSAAATLAALQQTVTSGQTNTLPSISAALKGSEILSVVPLPHSRLKPLMLYGAIGLIVGLVIGLSIVIMRALVSDRLRQRSDIAYALDAPVKLSVGRLRARRWLLPLPGRAAKRDRDMRRVIAHLHNTVSRSAQNPVSLAIVAVDNAPVVAPAVTAFATACASKGNRVVAADLSRGAHMAHLLGVKRPGVNVVSRGGVNFTIVVPDRDDAAPVGPLRAVTFSAEPAQAGDTLVASYASADLLLTLVTLDPALGGDHLATWAANSIVVVNAGHSSAERLHSVGEMIRLAGTRLDSVVLVEADKSDESLGVTPRPDEQTGIDALSQ